MFVVDLDGFYSLDHGRSSFLEYAKTTDGTLHSSAPVFEFFGEHFGATSHTLVNEFHVLFCHVVPLNLLTRSIVNLNVSKHTV